MTRVNWFVSCVVDVNIEDCNVKINLSIFLRYLSHLRMYKINFVIFCTPPDFLRYYTCAE